MNKTSANLGEKNIARNVLDSVSPSPLRTLYWREEASSPAVKTIEIWMATDGFFIVFSGLYDGSWSPTNVQPIQDSKGPIFDSLDAAMAAVKRNFSFGELEEPHEQTATKVKRLLKRFNGNF